MAQQLPTIRTHYRICMQLNKEWENEQERKRVKDGQVFSPLSLKHICRGAITKNVNRAQLINRLRTIALPQDIREFIESEDLSIFEFYRTAPRDCVDESSLRVGNFGEYRNILLEPNKYCFSANLREQARAVVKLLSLFKSMKFLDDTRVVSHILHVRYPLWIGILRAKKENVTLVPPYDVQAIWLTHMLQSISYREFAMKQEISNEPHSVCLLLSEQQHSTALSECERVWRNSKAKEPFQLNLSQFDSPSNVSSSSLTSLFNRSKSASQKSSSPTTPISPMWKAVCPVPPKPRDCSEDRLWFTEFLKVTSHLDLNDKFFLRAQLGYQRFMYLMAKYPRGLERLNFAPSPPIDLMWHTHLLQPAVYRKDMLRVVRHIPEHKLLASFDRSVQTYEERTSSEESMWQKEFKESMVVYATRL